MKASRLFSGEARSPSARHDATLFSELHAFAIRSVPARFYLALQLAMPAALSLWSSGWRRSAAWMVVFSAFGVWALCEQRLDQTGDADMSSPPPRAWLPFIHQSAAIVAVLTAIGLSLELFVKLMTKIAGCPGCAG